MITYSNHRPGHCTVVFDGPDPVHEARIKRMVAAVHAFAELSPEEQQAQIATWPVEYQREYLPEALQKAA